MRTKLSLEPSKKSLALCSSAAATAFLLCCGVGWLGVSNISNARADLEETEARVQDGRQIARRLAESRERYEAALTDLKCLEANVSTRAYVPTMLKQMEQLGESVNLKVVAVRPVAEAKRPPAKKASSSEDGKKSSTKKPEVTVKEPAPGFPKQRIDITTEGTFAEALSFLYRLTTFPKIVTVNSVEMSPLGSRARLVGPDDGKLSVKFNVTAFVLEESTSGKHHSSRGGSETQEASAPAPVTRRA